MHGCARGPPPVGAVGWQVQSAPEKGPSYSENIFSGLISPSEYIKTNTNYILLIA